ncbi:MAG TPA: hypothetical protein VGP36_18790 [Mycobacteriales bacterium]|nr:hypothetical protein [Mycobacteriales bacterium]
MTATGTTEKDAAADLLFGISQGRLPHPVPDILSEYGDGSVDPGAELQVAVLDRWQAAGERVGGWKIAWTSRGGRDRGGVGYRPFGYILASRIVRSGATLSRADIHVPVLEAELCLTMGAELSGPAVTVEQARAAVAAVSPSFEICSRRGMGLSLAARVGNAMNNWGLVVGPEQDPARATDAVPVRLVRDGVEVSSGVTDRETVDDPFLSLTRVCASLDAFGLGLHAGDRLLTGSILAGADVGEAREMTATFGDLGSVTINFG